MSQTKDVHKARCTLCLKDIDLSSMGESPWKIKSRVLERPGKVLEFYLKKTTTGNPVSYLG